MNLVENLLESSSIEEIRSLIEQGSKRTTYTDLKRFNNNNFQRVPAGKWESGIPIDVDVYDQPLRVVFTFFDTDKTTAQKWIDNFTKKNNIPVVDIYVEEKPFKMEMRVSEYSSKTKTLSGIKSFYTCIVDTSAGVQKLACSREMLKESSKTTVEAKGKGHFEVSFKDGLNDVAFHTSLAQVMWCVVRQNPYREPVSISWVQD